MINSSTDGVTQTWIMKAGETTLNIGCAAVLDTDNTEQCKRPTGSGASNVVGILLDSTHVAGEAAAYQLDRVCNCVAGDAVTAGSLVMVGDVAGRLITHDGSATAEIVGRALQAAAQAGDRFRVLVSLPNPYTT